MNGGLNDRRSADTVFIHAPIRPLVQTIGCLVTRARYSGRGTFRRQERGLLSMDCARTVRSHECGSGGGGGERKRRSPEKRLKVAGRDVVCGLHSVRVVLSTRRIGHREHPEHSRQAARSLRGRVSRAARQQRREFSPSPVVLLLSLLLVHCRYAIGCQTHNPRRRSSPNAQNGRRGSRGSRARVRTAEKQEYGP